MPDPVVLEVLLHGQPIGTLTLLAGDQSVFAFSEHYIDDPNRFPLSLSFVDTLGNLITDIKPTRRRVPPYFANLLPEGQMRTYLADRAGVNPQREFFLLEVLGYDLPGAVQVRRPEEAAAVTSPIPESAVDVQAELDEKPFRFSLAGVQLKFSAVLEARGGLTVPVEGVGGSWIVKLPSTTFEAVPENEFTMMNIAREIGLEVPEVRLVPLDEITGLPAEVSGLRGKALAVRRFDRAADGTAIHMEDFAQVFGVYPEGKYKNASYRNIAEVLWAEAGEEAIGEFVRRVVFSVLIGNADMHLKNWSLIYDERGKVLLSPGYDFVSTITYIAEDRDMALNLYGPGTKAMSEVSLESLTKLAAKARLPERVVLGAASETVERFNAGWRHAGDLGPLPASIKEAIDAHLGAVPLVSEVLGARATSVSTTA